MESKLKELIIAYVKADSDVESQESHLADLKRVRGKIANNLTNRIHEAIGDEDDVYLDYGDGVLFCSYYNGDMQFVRIHTIDVDDLKSLKAE